MVDDAIIANQNVREKVSSTYQEPFYNMVQVAQQPLYDSCSTHSELYVAVRLLNIKFDYNMPQNYFNEAVQLMKEMCPPNNRVLNNYGQTKRLLKISGNDVVQIDCCRKGCMLFYKKDANLDVCKFCGHSRWKRQMSQQRNQNPLSYSRTHYLPLKPRLQRLYASRSSAEHMRWHYEHRLEDDLLCHQSDGVAWKHFDTKYPEFAVEPRNVRLNLCANGYNPYTLSSRSYSIWPVVVTPYNLPP